MDPHSPPEPSIVLIVDDDKLLTDLFRQAMTRHGFQVLEANDGAGALALLNAQPVHLLLLDMTLPDMSGLHVAQMLAETHPLLPILIATGHDPDPATLPDNVVGVIRKPFSMRTLAARLHALVAPT